MHELSFEETALLRELIVATACTDLPLTPAEIDAVLGLAPREETSVECSEPEHQTSGYVPGWDGALAV